MESQNEHISLLTNLLPQYRLINSIYEQIIDSLKLSFDNQCRITDFHNTFKNKQVFEKAVLNLLLSADKEKLALITANLKEEINKNIELYIANKEQFNNIDTLYVCTKRPCPLRFEIKGQLEITNKLGQELTPIRNSLESASWNNDKVVEQQLTRKEEQVKSLYKKEQDKLNKLYQQQKESDRNAIRYVHNVFGDVCDLSNSFISLLDKYFPIEKERGKASNGTPTITPGIYFDMNLVSQIHQQCNNIQFENLSETDFYALLNLQPCNSRLTVKDREGVRVCYLIYKLYEHLKSESRAQWRTAILTSAGIKEEYYKSKYKEPISEIPSRKSENFAKRIDEIFNNPS
ncbi:hypothetical protein [Dysgonomonas sp. 511]|uniref:hypothetical protein n=1 Tax=Dysgonomonas sp. 511 TaxID=2302930 RepID=UPI0013D8ABFD|nr:hypothetical protein [Dysgonomonas sp. 511]NDV80210.1 hypothetical protein [Dysgonomonas sp. 511]